MKTNSLASFAVFAAFALPAWSYQEFEIEANGTTWTVAGSGVDHEWSLDKAEQTQGILCVPSDLRVPKDKDETQPVVTEICEYAFSRKTGLTGVVVPSGFKLRKGSFYYCTGLTKVVLGNNVTHYGTPWPFTGCNSIRDLQIGIYPDGFSGLFSSSYQNIERLVLNQGTYIPQGYCSEMSKLVSVSIPEGFKEIRKGAFSRCSSLPVIGLPSSLTTIGDRVFRLCTSLSGIRIPNNVTSIGEDAFYGCSSMREAILSSSLQSIGAGAFEGCSLLSDISVPSGVSSIGEFAFADCPHLMSASIPDQLSEVVPYLFDGDFNLRWVNIPSAARSIGDGAFRGCRGLVRADLPDGIESIGDSAFFECRLLRSVFLPSMLSEIGDSAFEGCTGIRELTIPDQVSSIGNRAFADCSSLAYLALPPDTTVFGDEMFDGCTRLDTVVLPASLRGNTDWLGIPDGCEVLFYDDTDAVSLAEVGADALRPFTTVKRFCRNGTTLERSVPGVVTNAATPGVRHVCEGWNGAGDVPASGAFSETPEDVSVSFTMTQNSRLRWIWRTDVRIDIEVEGGTCDFASGWIEQGQAISIRLHPDDEVFDIVLEGDTIGVTKNGAILSFLADVPRSLRIVMRPRPDFVLSVSSAHGTPIPAAGTTRVYRNGLVTASVAEPEPGNGVRYVCTGWHGSGDVPSEGTATNLSFVATQNSSIAWQWTTNVWIGLELRGPVVTDEPVWDWKRIGVTVVAHYDPTGEYITYELSGDTNGVAWDRTARTLTIPCDAPRSIRFAATEHTLSTALDSKGFAWLVYGSSPWYPQVEDSSDGVDALRSGDVPGGGCILKAGVMGPGTLSWKWKLDASGAGTAGIDLLVDNVWKDSLEWASDWTDASLDIAGEGRHTVRFDFWNAGDDHARGYLDAIAWSGACCTTTNSPVGVPFDWIDGYELAPRGDYERVAVERAANGKTVWQCYIAGLDPGDPDADFRAGIIVSNDVPVVTFDPDLGAARHYIVEGKENLSAPWGGTNANTRFFRVKVELNP